VKMGGGEIAWEGKDPFLLHDENKPSRFIGNPGKFGG